MAFTNEQKEYIIETEQLFMKLQTQIQTEVLVFKSKTEVAAALVVVNHLK